MLTSVHFYADARRLCDVDLSSDTLAKLDKPPMLRDPFMAEDHVVHVATPHGTLTLFRVAVNGVPMIVTPTPEVAIANAA